MKSSNDGRSLYTNLYPNNHNNILKFTKEKISSSVDANSALKKKAAIKLKQF